MLCCVSPASNSYDETLASLRFAQRAKLVKNVARINVDPAAARMAALEGQLRALQARSTLLEAALARRLGLGWPLPQGAGAQAQAARALLDAELAKTKEALRTGAAVAPEHAHKAQAHSPLSSAPAAAPAAHAGAPASAPAPLSTPAPAAKSSGCSIM